MALIAIVCLPAVTGAKSTKPTLQDLVFTPDHLISNLGPKTLFWSEHKEPALRREDFAVLHEIGLDQKTRLFEFPTTGTGPVVKRRKTADYPRSLENQLVGGEAEFLVLVDAKGKVVSLHCFRRTYNAFGLSAAMALLRWRFEPAQIGDTKVPVLMRFKWTFEAPIPRR